jgi:selenocysteine lyase/cysteine desulfurase
VAHDRYEIRPDARRFENWESYVAGKIGLGVAVSYALEWGLGAIRERVYALAAGLRARLASVPGVTVRDRGAERCGIVTFTMAGREPGAIKQALLTQGINVHVSATGDSRLEVESRDVSGVVRASVHYYNSEDEIERLCAALAALAKR